MRWAFLSLALLGAAPQTDGQMIGNWKVEVDKDAMTDAISTSVHVRADNARIDYGCTGRNVMMIVTTDAFLGGGPSGDSRRIMFRVDGGQPVSVVWRYNDDMASSKYPDVIRPAVAAMRGGKSMTVRAEAYRGEPVEATFDITGVDRALALVDLACAKKS